ncbi:hypothetical protein Q7C_1907 [Methylophaga frappieri]|uniref:Uncharacterized protein n=1 Tax=Methylophaga frappieri (strain ATCC BAA-2434 / DSM 25690 / JAM7) TaxID=754477 RepID=I1YJF5_METFJ|nr:hypothetical protein Q7C_1907 [Methylophaga frappieri]
MEEVVECLSASELSTTPSNKLNFWEKAISGALLFGSFILGMQNK